jgi:hypothetical protein
MTPLPTHVHDFDSSEFESFLCSLGARPIDSSKNPWALIIYQVEETFEGHPTGSFFDSAVYFNKKNQLKFVGDAKTHYQMMLEQRKSHAPT